ncbi:LINE-1 retrotransposable element ORF1 protein [Dissostichus eleginoides]|uniref:LINE-1 retrotransposable element ORF1 protein n=1 Tax=Dissostichus eleginoides TaxID=100907 RepID=A0AAD9B8X6_DISEL|nr:LINE-1 retrotransposable element ORF1 protein [Dissostichus eleginoides]
MYVWLDYRRVQKEDPVRFIEKWLPDYLKMTTRKGKIKLDRAHRSMAPKPGPEQRSRPIILKFHNFADKQLVMNAARKLGLEPCRLAHTGPRISFFNDYSAAVVKKCKAFDEIKYRLRKKSIDYALIYPATLKVMINGTERRFDTPEGAAAFAESLDGTN